MGGKTPARSPDGHIGVQTGRARIGPAPRRLPDFEAWAIFAKVAERGSFSHAAHELGLAGNTVSKAISRLETRLRTTLIQRTTRSLSVTEAGRISLERARRILDDGAAVEADALEDAEVPRGLVRLVSPGLLAITTLADLLPGFLRLYPDIQLDLRVTEDRVDLVRDGIDLALKIGSAPDSSWRISRLSDFRPRLVAAPTYFLKYGRPDHPRDLGQHQALVEGPAGEVQEWRFQHSERGVHVVRVDGPMRFNNIIAATPALFAGVGLMLQPEMIVRSALEDGSLEEALPQWRAPLVPISILTPPGKARPARTRVLEEFLRAEFVRGPWARGMPHAGQTAVVSALTAPIFHRAAAPAAALA